MKPALLVLLYKWNQHFVLHNWYRPSYVIFFFSLAVYVTNK